VVQNALVASAFDHKQVKTFVESIEDQDFLRNAIVADGTFSSVC
jgi:hypothetical protein